MEKLVEIFAWPLAVVVIAVVCLLIFRSPVSDLINRIRRLSYGNKSVDMNGGQATIAVEKQKKPDAVATITASDTIPAAHAKPPPNEIYDPFEQRIRAILTSANYPYDLERDWLIREVAIARVQRIHEINYRLVLGSQINLMLLANTKNPPTTEKAREIFDQAKAMYPALYQDFTFEAWKQYPTNIGLLRAETTATGITLFRITPAGRDFLHYLVDNSLTDPKAG
jgi:hypothetical protein